MEYICDGCDNLFDEPKRLKDMGGDIGEDVWVCPYCGCENYEEAIECAICGDVVRESETENCVCEKCVEKYAGREHAERLGDENKEFIRINGFLASLFDSDSEIETILWTEAKRRYYESELEKHGKDYCTDDTDSFTNYMKKRGAYLL